MALSQIVYTGDGVTTQFVVNFALGYINPLDVVATVNGSPVPYEWASANTIRITGPAVASGAEIRFIRSVPKDRLVVDFEDGAIQTEENLNTAVKQAIMVGHEALDFAERNSQRIDNLVLRTTIITLTTQYPPFVTHNLFTVGLPLIFLSTKPYNSIFLFHYYKISNR